MDTVSDVLVSAGWMGDLERSNSGRLEPCYRYIRHTDRVPSLLELRSLEAETVILRVKLFSPGGAMSWYVATYEPNQRLAWGAVDNGRQLTTGPISMSELVRLRTPRLHLPIERDLTFNPRTLRELSTELLR